MPNLSFLIISLLASLQVFANEELCFERVEYFSQNKSSLDLSLKKIPITNENIIFIGVEHLNYQLDTYPLLIDAIKSAGTKIDCFLLETELSDIEKNEITKLNQGIDPVNWNNLSLERSQSFVDLLKLINSKNLKIYAVDKDIEIDDDLTWLNERDKAMSVNINKLIKSNTCKKPIFPVGTIHLLNNYPGIRSNLPANLTKMGLKTYKIGLSISGIRELDHQGKHRIGSISAFTSKSISLKDTIHRDDFICKDIPKLIHEPYTLDPNDFKNPVLFDPYTESFIGELDDVNFWLYYSCQTKDCDKKNSQLAKKLENLGINLH